MNFSSVKYAKCFAIPYVNLKISKTGTNED